MKRLRQSDIAGSRSTIFAGVLLVFIAAVALGCTANESEEAEEITDITNFVVVPSENEGDLDDGEVSGDFSTCVLAPRIGTLVIARVVSINLVSVGREVTCKPEWKYTKTQYRDIEVELIEELAGPSLGGGTMTLKAMSPFGVGASSIEPGDFRMMKISPQLEGDHFMLSSAPQILPNGAAVPDIDGTPSLRYTFPNNVADLKAELASFMAQNDPLPIRCPNYTGAMPRIDEDLLRFELFLDDREDLERPSCDPDPDDSSDAGWRPPDGYVGVPDAGE